MTTNIPAGPQSYAAPQQRQAAKRSASRWLIPLTAGFAGLLFGFGVAGGADDSGSRSQCSDMAAEYAALVSEGLDAGLSMDEAWMAEVVAKRDDLRESMQKTCG